MQTVHTAAAYIRVSTLDQAEYSPESQLRAIRDYALHHGLRLPDHLIFVDEGISGRSAQRRPEFLRMIALARTRPRPFDVILLWKYSRFARSREDSVVYKALLRRECGIQVVSVSEPVGQDKLSVLIEAMIEAMDEYYSLNLSEEVRRGMAEKHSRGEPVSAPPLGYRMQKGRFVPDPEHAETVRMVYRMFLGGESASGIARRLDAVGLRTRRGNPFETRSVLYLLRNPVYTGYIGDVEAHEALVAPEDFQRVQERLARVMRRGRHDAPSREGYMLRGLVRCSACGRMMVRTGGRMQCSAYARGRCAVSHSIAYTVLEERILRCIERDFGEERVPLCGGTRRDSQASGERAQIRRRMERLRLAYEDGVIDLDEFSLRRSELEQALTPPRPANLCSKTERTLSVLLRTAQDGVWKNGILLAFVREVVFDRTENRVSVYYFDA